MLKLSIKPDILFSLIIVSFLLPLLVGAAIDYNNPESVVYDAANDRYLVSNTGDGNIIARSPADVLSYFSQGASTSIRGLTIMNNTLYAAGDEGVMAFNLSNGQKTSTIVITERDFLNGITSDAAGNLYVSDNARIYKVDPVAGTYTTVITTDGANGVLFDEANNRLLFTDEGPVGFDGSYISAIDMVTTNVTNLVSNTFRMLDGLTRDGDGNYYVSSWSTNKVYRYDQNFANPAVEVSIGHNGPAAIFYDTSNDILAIPNFDAHTVDYKPAASLLPVELVAFYATVVGDNIELTWQTAAEKNNYGFEILRKNQNPSLNNENWETIGFVGGHGTINSPNYYHFVDRNHPANSLLYRLKQIDTDGSFEYSEIIKIDIGIPTNFELSQNYPNPFNPSTTISYSIPKSSNVKLTVYNSLGKEVAILINGYKQAGKYTVNFEALELSGGIYFYHLTTNNFSMTKKMLMMN